MKDLLVKILELKEKERAIKHERELLEVEVYESVADQMNGDSSATFYADNYKLKITPNFAVKVDQNMASDFPDAFKVKYEMTYSQYKKYEDKLSLADVVTITPNKPTFAIEVM